MRGTERLLIGPLKALLLSLKLSLKLSLICACLSSQLLARATGHQGAVVEPWEQASWRAVMRYRSQLWGGARSEVVSPEFFSHEQGATAPRLEWLATLERLEQLLAAAEQRPTLDHSLDPLLGPLCAHPDRYLVMARLLKLTALLEPILFERCPEVASWAQLASEGLDWVHAGPTFRRPESSLGHSSLRLRAKGGLSHSASFGAQLQESFDRARALFGVAEGDWSLQPYERYEQRYREREGRDIAVITLSNEAGSGGSEAARRLLGLHLLSLRGSSVSYSFFGNNCATQSARLVEAASAMAGERPVYPSPERWGLSPLEAASPQVERARALTLRPALSLSLQALTLSLSSAERSTLEALNEAAVTWLESGAALEALDLSVPWALESSERLWRAALMSLKLRYSSALSLPPQEGAPSERARLWSLRQALLLKRGEASEMSTAEPERSERSAQAAQLEQRDQEALHDLLSAPHRLRFSLSAPIAPQLAVSASPSRLGAQLRWGLRSWAEPLSSPDLGGHRRLFASGPALTGTGLTGTGLKLHSGQLISLWDLSELNSPAPQLSWRLSLVAGHLVEGQAPWLSALRGGLGGALRSPKLKLRAWLHLGGRAGLIAPNQPHISPLISGGLRGRALSALGWSLYASSGLGLPDTSWLSSPPLSLNATMRLRLASYLRILLELQGATSALSGSTPSHPSPLRLWLGLEL